MTPTEHVDELLREIVQMTDNAGIKRKATEAMESLKSSAPSSAALKVGEPYLHDGGDGVKGHYCIGRKHPDGYFEFWNKGRWCSAGEVFVLVDSE